MVAPASRPQEFWRSVSTCKSIERLAYSLLHQPSSMARDDTHPAASLPATPIPALKKSTSNTQNMKNQKTLFGFFQKTPHTASSTSSLPNRLATNARKSSVLATKNFARSSSSQITPAPSSDALDEDDKVSEQNVSKECLRSKEGLPSPVSSANGESVGQTVADAEELTAFGTPSRKVSQAAGLPLMQIELMWHRQKRRS